MCVRFGGGNIQADLSMNVGGNSVTGDVTYTENGNALEFSVDTGSSDLVDSVKYSRSGAGWSFKPTFNLKAKNMDLEASADYSADTNLNVKVGADGSSRLEVNHRLDADTSLNLQGAGADINNMEVEVSRKLDGSNTVKPKFNMATKHMTMQWIRNLDAGRTMTVNVDPDNSMGFEVEGASDEDWKASVSAPWGNFADADVSFGRKFNF